VPLIYGYGFVDVPFANISANARREFDDNPSEIAETVLLASLQIEGSPLASEQVTVIETPLENVDVE
jgi:hypothetical protein